MNINNIALVRATNIIPFDVIVRPISNSPYLTKNIGLEFSTRMSDFLHEVGIIPGLDESKMFDDDYYDEMVALSSKILKEYLPYVSDYNSFVLFSLNGLCPDDNEHGFGNNTFSNKKCAIIDGLNHHIEETISLVPTDTLIKGDVYLSNEAIILIEEQTFANLSEDQKNMLSNLNLTIKTFTGSLKETVYNELKNSGKYTPEILSLSASTRGFLPSVTSEMQIELINKLAEYYDLSQKRYFNLITSKDESMPKYDEVCNEFGNMLKVQEYYMTIFLQKLLNKLNAPKDMINSIEKNLYSRVFMSKVIELIKSYGIENYKKFLDEYNEELEKYQRDGTLILPKEIVNAYNDNKKKGME